MALKRSRQDDDFDNIVRAVHHCRACERMNESQRIFGRSAGSLTAKLMFIGEAPGRLGADETHIPFHGDASGRNFEQLIYQVGLNRSDLFITNAVLCNPRTKDGNNATPLPGEIQNCTQFLVRQINLVDPPVVVTLGTVALRALEAIDRHDAKLASHVRKVIPWFGRKLIPLYHPGQRALVHRSFHNQLADYQFVSEEWRRVTEPRKRRAITTRVPDVNVMALASALTQAVGNLSYFALHKLTFLTEYLAMQRYGHALSDAYFIRQKDGPYCVQLHYKTLRLASRTFRLVERRGQLQIEADALLPFETAKLSTEARQVIADVVDRFGKLADHQLKTRVYLTSPMKSILRREKSGANLFNAPIDLRPETQRSRN